MQTVTQPDDFKMSLMDHLVELRKRVLQITLVVLGLGIVSMAMARPIYGLLMRPILMALPEQASSLVYTSAIEEINVLMKIGLYSGLFLSTPVVLFHIWGFVAPGLYAAERRFALPFIVFGSLAFVAGAMFCYFILLPQMFGFLLKNEDVASIQTRINLAKYREEDVIRLWRLGEVDRSSALARAASGDLEAPGAGQTEEGALGVSLIPKESVDAEWRLAAAGRLIDALRVTAGDSARPVLVKAVEKRDEAISAMGKGLYSTAITALEELATTLASAAPSRSAEIAAIWKLEKLIGLGQSRADAINWTRPMLSMSEQLTLVLVLLLAFGVIFELPLVMALLGLVGFVSASFLLKYQRHAFVVCLITAAIITPTGDAVNLALMAGPMLLCYQLGVFLVWMIEKRRRNVDRSDATQTS